MLSLYGRIIDSKRHSSSDVKTHPAESGCDSVTYTVKRLLSAAAFSRTFKTTRDDECVRIFCRRKVEMSRMSPKWMTRRYAPIPILTAPSLIKVWHSLPTLPLDRDIFFRKSSPRSIITFLHCERSYKKRSNRNHHHNKVDRARIEEKQKCQLSITTS